MAPVEPRERHWELAAAAVMRDGEGQRALLAGDTRTAQAAFAAAADLYRQSWDLAPPGAYGRLVGMMKAAVLAGGGAAEAQYVREALADAGDDSPAASYARAIAALVLDDDATAVHSAAAMRAGSDAFTRAADAVAAVATRDETAYRAAVTAIVHDFESRDEHLTGVPIADTALMLERLATPRGMSADVASALFPPVSG